ncbi:MAG: hypothetical protein ACK4SY_08695 [Pyrobaculum sp.]
MIWRVIGLLVLLAVAVGIYTNDWEFVVTVIGSLVAIGLIKQVRVGQL